MTAPNNGGLKGGNEHLRKRVKKPQKKKQRWFVIVLNVKRMKLEMSVHMVLRPGICISVPANLGPNTFEEKYERIQRLGKNLHCFLYI